MRFSTSNNIDKVWASICKHEGEKFYTKTHIEFTYEIKDDYVIVSIPSQTRIAKTYFEKTLKKTFPNLLKSIFVANLTFMVF